MHLTSTVFVNLAWLSGNVAAHINEVTVCRTRLVLGWVTVSGFNSRCGTFISVHDSHPSELSLAIPSWVGAMSTSQRATKPCGWGLKACMVCVWVAVKTV